MSKYDIAQMTDGQREILYTGMKMEQDRIIKLLEKHKQTTKTVSGFLGVCSCGEGIDDYNEHLQELIKGEQK